MQIALTGDVMLGRLVDRYVIQDPHLPLTTVWGDVLPLLLAADLRLINLECVISTQGAKWHPETKPFHFRAHPRAIDVLKTAQIDCVTLANNHSLDYGVAALAECLSLLDRAGIAHAGAGLNLAAASRPVLLHTAAETIGVVALTDNEPAWAAAEEQPGVNFVAYDMSGLIEPYRSRIANLLADVGARADLVIVSAHVGPNWGPPSAAIQALAHQIIDLGADLYWGHSNHAPQGMEVYRGKPILYAAGDFIDDYAIDPIERNDRSFLFIATVERHRIRRITLYPVAIEQLQVRLAQEEEARWLQERMRGLSAALACPIVVGDGWCELAIA